MEQVKAKSSITGWQIGFIVFLYLVLFLPWVLWATLRVHEVTIAPIVRRLNYPEYEASVTRDGEMCIEIDGNTFIDKTDEIYETADRFTVDYNLDIDLGFANDRNIDDYWCYYIEKDDELRFVRIERIDPMYFGLPLRDGIRLLIRSDCTVADFVQYLEEAEAFW